jgi:hypothetical protein
VTAGLRVDIPSLPAPALNPTLDTSVLDINTADFPSGNALWSPRIGFNYDLSGDQTSMLRGGVGVFSGRPPYVWVSNAYTNTGLEQATLVCSGAANVPTFTIDPDNQPTTCAGGGGATAPIPSIVFFDPDFKFPQNLKVALGLDHQLPWGVVGTFDFVYTKSINQFYISDVNLQGIVDFSVGENGRPLYGTINPANGSTTPALRSTSFRDVLRHRNESQDRALQVTLQAQKRFSDGLEFNVGYTYSRTEDLFSLTSSIASSNYRFTALDGTLENRTLRPSVFDIPHKFTLSGTFAVPYGVRASLIYIRQSGHPFTYVTSNDINGDTFGGNDAVYVPRNASDITLASGSSYATLDAFIESEECLRENRGHVLPRNSCRNNWLTFLDARFVKILPTVSGQSLELTADVFNLPHLISRDWGVIKETSAFETTNLLRATGYDVVNDRGVYSLSTPLRNRVTSARWRIQLGVKYLF